MALAASPKGPAPQERFASSRNPWTFIPTLYFAEGVPYIIINAVSVILYKRMGIDNAQIALWTSFLYLPWVIKMFWGPFVDIYSTKRNWIIYTQIAMCACLFLIATTLGRSHFFFMSLAGFMTGAFISATHDIAADGFYMIALTKEDQAFFVGIRATFYRLAMIFGSGFLVYFAGRLETSLDNIAMSWTLVMHFAALVFLLLFVYHKLMLPYPTADRRALPQDSPAQPFAGSGGQPAIKKYREAAVLAEWQGQPAPPKDKASFNDVFRSYFKQDKIWAILAFILLYRLGEAILMKMVTPFMLDPAEAGGLGLSTSQVGIVYGTVGVLSLVIGGILGGWLISRFGFKKCIWPMVIALKLPDIFYVYMAYAHPPMGMIYPLVALEQFGYGLGFTAFMVYLMYIAKGKYKTSHFAISTGIMALGMMLPGMISGYLQEALGYRMFFIAVCLLTIPGMMTIFFIPQD